MSGRLIVVGWDAASWPLFSPLLDSGAMPCLASLIESGASGRLLSNLPLIPPCSWATLTTGVGPRVHDVLADLDPCRAPALADRLAQCGLHVHSVNWPNTHPARPLRGGGVMVSPFFGQPVSSPDEDWPVPPGVIEPEAECDDLLALRFHGGDLLASDLREFVPALHRIDQNKDTRLHPLASALGQAITAHSVATQLLATRPADALFVRYSLLGDLCGTYARFAEPRLPGVPAEDVELFQAVLPRACAFLDQMLARLVSMAGTDAHVAVLSPLGFQTGASRPQYPGPPGPKPDHWLSAWGFVCLSGPGFAGDALLHGATTLDVVPTLLAARDLPIPDALPGRVLSEALPKAARRTTAAVSTSSQMHEGPALTDLQALGYNEQDRVSGPSLARRLAEGSLALSENRLSDAASAFEDVLREAPEHRGALVSLAFAYLQSGQWEACQRVIEKLDTTEAPNAPSRGISVLLRGRLLLAQNKTGEAMLALSEAESEARNDASVATLFGDIHRLSGRTAEAERWYRIALEQNSETMLAWLGLALVGVATDDARAAADAALEVTRLDFSSRPAHQILLLCGEALRNPDMSRTAEAVLATLP